MYIELPFGIILASKDRITHTDPSLLQLKLYQDWLKDRAESAAEQRKQLAESQRLYIAASAAKGTLNAENQELKRIIERLETGIQEREARISAYRGEIASLNDALSQTKPAHSSPETPAGKLDDMLRRAGADDIDIADAKEAQYTVRAPQLASKITSPWDYIPGLTLEDSEVETPFGAMDIT